MATTSSTRRTKPCTGPRPPERTGPPSSTPDLALRSDRRGRSALALDALVQIGNHLATYSRHDATPRYSINVTLDGCCDHRAFDPGDDVHRHAAENLDRADALLLGRVTYELMESGWRTPTPTGEEPVWTEPFARTINAAKKYVVSSTLDAVDWNAELVVGDLGTAVGRLKREPGNGLAVGGLRLALALAELGLIDEYEFVVHPRIAGHGPTLFAGLSKHLDLQPVGRLEFDSGVVATRYEPSR